MHVAFHDQLAFHLTGRLSAGALEPIDGRGLLPALFAPYCDLAALRHDFPLVLTPGTPAQSLSGLFDAALADAGDGEAAERLRGHAGRMERALRRLAAEGVTDGLADAWEIASAELTDADAEVRESLDGLRPALPRDGTLAACDRAVAGRVLRHEWSEGQSARLARLSAMIGRLAAGLEDILRADFAASPEGRRPERLRAAMGSALAANFDFDAMARLLDRTVPAPGLDDERRRRITWLLTVLRSQRYAPLPGSGAIPYGFAFATAGEALEAWRERLPAAAELARAIAMARLEVAGEYHEAEHDALFAGTGHTGPALDTDAPSYLVCLTDQEPTPDEAALLLDALGAGLPFKVLVQTDDLLAAGDGTAAVGLRVRPLAATALSLGDVYVLQASASQLFSQLARVQAGLAYDGPALFSVYSGAGPATAGLPPYLAAAAAVESRAFPAFACDPGAGPDWASRFSLDGNPQAGNDWPVHALEWEDAAHQRQGETVAFTLVDFLACDRRVAPHLARIAPDAWNGHLVPVAEALARPQPDAENRMPCLTMADAREGLHKVLADDVLLHETRRCLDRWHVLQELGGIHNSHAQRALEAARLAATAQAAPVPPSAAPPAAEPPVTEAAPPEEAAEPEREPGVPYIESARCTTCNECINVNNRMFGYDVNRKASIIDATAGTFRQLVEAAENCQVSIIHPGKPRDPNEPGLEELLTRAAPFL